MRDVSSSQEYKEMERRMEELPKLPKKSPSTASDAVKESVKKLLSAVGLPFEMRRTVVSLSFSSLFIPFPGLQRPPEKSAVC